MLSVFAGEYGLKPGTSSARIELNISHDPRVTPIFVSYVLVYLTMFISSTDTLPIYYDENYDSLRILENSERMFSLKASEAQEALLLFTTPKGK